MSTNEQATAVSRYSTWAGFSAKSSCSIGFDVLEPYLIHGVRGGLAPEAERKQQKYLEQRTLDYQARLTRWAQWPSIPFNQEQDFIDGQSLRPGAPTYSPFVRHIP
ncbi:NAD(P)H dehydrogenase (quinone) [Pseudomonas chlororaphis subsp. aurantiaca]|uniref:NAD(P)H dehydrogenase n=1 Tax=Pseudomonas chlororaphis TaxID=587753 RepID=UPI000F5886CF|nr:NAD(P)H dehydrogenase [Pseudomonas chlororaphis]AZD55293.1 NAD(P)H dehydrogenase (quinone) [Pseudomonas chlororaphis subsp. aurantiaca]